MPSNHLILWCPLLLLPSVFPSIKAFSNESALYIRWPKYWSFSTRPSNVNIGVHVSFQIMVFMLYRYIPRNEIAGACGSSIFMFLRNLCLVFHSGCTKLHSHQQCTKVPFCPHLHQHVLFIVFLQYPFLQLWSDVSSWFCSSLMISNVEDLFKYLLAICMSSLGNIYSVLLPIFYLDCLFFCYSVVCVPYIFWVLTPYDLQTFSPIV